MKNKPARTRRILIKILKNGPYEVIGNVPLRKQTVVSGQDGVPVKWGGGPTLRPADKPYHLCRCGHSSRKPYCDGTHLEIKFNGAEAAGRRKHAETAESTFGPGLELRDAEKLCAVGLFCHRAGDAWTLTEKSGNKKPGKQPYRRPGTARRAGWWPWMPCKANLSRSLSPG